LSRPLRERIVRRAIIDFDFFDPFDFLHKPNWGYYEITDRGRAYLAGELGADDLEDIGK